jgi:DnaJ-class molecular chaperone
MDFGKRLAGHGDSSAAAVQQTCVRCCGTGRIRERGDRIICKTCAGTGRINTARDRAS